jgi:hypothetical protein
LRTVLCRDRHGFGGNDLLRGGGLDGLTGFEVSLPGGEFVSRLHFAARSGFPEIFQLNLDVEEQNDVENGQREHVNEQED